MNRNEAWELFEKQGFKDGHTYQLTRDVPNPKPDRRVKDDWRYAPIIPKGTRVLFASFAFDSGKVGFGEFTSMRRLYRLMRYQNEELYDRLLTALEEVRDLTSELARLDHLYSVQGVELLNQLVLNATTEAAPTLVQPGERPSEDVVFAKFEELAQQVHARWVKEHASG